MSSEISFNPDALTLQPGDLTIQLTTIQKLKYDIYLARPEGDFLSHLRDEIERIPEPKQSKARTAHDKNEMALVVLGVAALEQVVSPEKIRIINHELDYLMPLVHFHWRSLVLFKAVTRYAGTYNIQLPESMKDARQAWGRSVLRAVNVQKYETKTPYRNVLTEAAKAIRQKRNPFGDAEPEDRDFLQYAFQFAHWDKAIGEKESWLPTNAKRQKRGSLRKDVRESIADYARSMTTLGSHYKNYPNLVAVQYDSENRARIVGQKGKYISTE